MGLLQHRLDRAGFRTAVFSYSTVRNAPRANALALNAFCRELDARALHFVGHSLGGLVLRHLFFDYPDQRPGRVVTLGTPHQPSSAAGSLSRIGPGRYLLGRSLQEGLLGGAPRWNRRHELGSIAGTLRLSFGRLVPGIPAPSDGTVAVAETRLDGMTDHITAPVSHLGLVLSRRVAEYTMQFLRCGRFGGAAQSAR
ncbi:MAG: alpha/beta hydrolase [Gammaproteobacteria bacterium]|nr:alpha/beta hydrolase [Gammaproteobacteria bacterium]